MKIPPALLFERNAEGFAVEFVACSRLANNWTKPCDKQNLYLSRFHGLIPSKIPLMKTLVVIVIYAAIGLTVAIPPKNTIYRSITARPTSFRSRRRADTPHSYLTLLHSRSMNKLSIHRTLLSMLIATPASLSTLTHSLS